MTETPTPAAERMARARAARIKDRPKRKYTRQRSFRFMTRDEVALLLGVHPLTVVRMEEDGRLPKPHRFGAKTVRHERALIEQYLQEASGEAQ